MHLDRLWLCFPSIINSLVIPKLCQNPMFVLTILILTPAYMEHKVGVEHVLGRGRVGMAAAYSITKLTKVEHRLQCSICYCCCC